MKTKSEALALPKYSVLMSVYASEKGENLAASLDSVLCQTLLPDEIVLVKDGPLTDELEAALTERVSSHPELFNIVSLEKNMGLGAALNAGLSACKNEYIARMDSDDICFPDRMEKQMAFLAAHPEVDILSGAIEEFDGGVQNITGRRAVPLDDEAIWRFARTRCPFNHNCVVYKKSKVMAVSGYRTDLKRVEDHDLWMRLRMSGAVGANLEDSILYARAGHDMHARRHGKENAKALYRFYRELYQLGEISLPRFLYDIVCACGLQLMPTWMHKLSYRLIRMKTTPYGSKKREKLPENTVIRALDDEETKRAQALILEIYKDVKALCDRRGLTIMLSGGSCLGAVRGQGFIPWDDDMDCVMPREDYERLKLIFDGALGDKYVMQVPSMEGHLACNPFMKIIRKDGPEMREITQLTSPGAKGLWLDIVPMDYAPENAFKRVGKGLLCDAVEYTAVSRFLFKYRNPVYASQMKRSIGGAVEYYLRNALGFVASVASCQRWFDLFDRLSQGKEKSKRMTFPAGIKHYLGECLPRDVFLPPAEGEFEGERVLLPAKAHAYLRNLYGADYMTPPPPSSRKRHEVALSKANEILLASEDAEK